MNQDWRQEYHRYRRYFTNIGQFYQQGKGRVYTEIILSLFTITFFLIFAIRPTLIIISGLIKTIKDQKITNQKLEEKINTLTLAQKEYYSVEPELYLIDSALPKTPQLSLLLKQIEALSRKTSTKINLAKFNPATLKEKTTSQKQESLDFSLSLTGDFPNLKSFLQSLPSLQRIITIESFSFSQEKEKDKGLMLSLEAKAYYLTNE